MQLIFVARVDWQLATDFSRSGNMREMLT